MQRMVIVHSNKTDYLIDWLDWLIDCCWQELMTQMQHYHDNLTYQMTAIESQKDKKQDLVWALTGQFKIR